MIAVLALALGIGATTAIFSIVHAIQLRPLAYPNAERLVHLFEDRTDQAGAVFRAPAMDLATHVQFPKQTRTLTSVGIYVGSHVALGGLPEPVRLASIRLSPGVFQMLGRGLEPADERPGQDDVIVLSHTAWRTHFQSDRDVVGRRILLDGRDATIVRVMPAGFHFPDRENHVWRPFPLPAQGNQARARLPLVAQLADGVSVCAQVASY